MTPRRSTARSRDIGLELFAIREKAGYDGLGLANRLGWDQSKVSRIEGGKQAIDEVDLIHWLSTCGVKSVRLRQLVDFNRLANQDTWVLPYGPASADSRNLVAEEKAAKKITAYACVLLPGLLQTPEYARAVTELRHDDEVVIARVVAQRTARQGILRGERAPKVVFYIEEQALTRLFGGRQVAHDQLMHLLFMADWKKVTIRVVPNGATHMAGQSAFLLFERRDQRSLAWVDTNATSVVFEADEHITAFETTIKELDRVALGEGDSRALIAKLADRLSGPREDPHDGDLA